jgi:hypothetical protein
MRKMKKTGVLFSFGVLVLALTLTALSGCESSDWAAISDGLNEGNNNFANSYSSSSDTGMMYTFHNRSSETVTLYDLTGEHSIPPGGSASARFNANATIYDVSYSPSSVSVSQSGTSFTFTD